MIVAAVVAIAAGTSTSAVVLIVVVVEIAIVVAVAAGVTRSRKHCLHLHRLRLGGDTALGVLLVDDDTVLPSEFVADMARPSPLAAHSAPSC